MSRLRSLALEIWLPVVVVVAWWFLSEDSTSVYFPPLRRILEVFNDTWIFEQVRPVLLPSLGRFAAGLAIAIVLGVVCGLALGLWVTGRRALMPLVDFMRSIPATALVSVWVILLGFGNVMKVTAIVFISFFPILLNTIDGVRGVDPNQLEMARAYKISRRDQVLKIVLPAASPQIFVGLRIGLAVALLMMAFSEMVAGTSGVGFFIFQAQELFKIPEMWTGILLLGLLGYAVNVLFLMVERRVLRWHRGWRESARDAGGGA
jgi:ABC-type nitrate/sulfonate/bicarbonate transport system permease component